MKLSRARNDASLGKSAKLVFAARARMSAVATWTVTSTGPEPAMWRVINDRTVCCSLGSGMTWIAEDR